MTSCNAIYPSIKRKECAVSHPQTKRWSNDTRSPKKKQWTPRSTERSLGFKTACVIFCLFLIYWGSVLRIPEILFKAAP